VTDGQTDIANTALSLRRVGRLKRYSTPVVEFAVRDCSKKRQQTYHCYQASDSMDGTGCTMFSSCPSVCVRAMCMLADTFFDRHAVGYCSVQFNVK